MTYAVALDKAWEDLIKLKPGKIDSVKFLGDEYSVDINARKIISLSCNIAAKEFTAVLVLHYLVQKLKGLPRLTGEWVSFKELSGGRRLLPGF